MDLSSNSGPSTIFVAEVIWAAAHDETGTLRSRDADAEALLAARQQQDDATFIGELKSQIGLESGRRSQPRAEVDPGEVEGAIIRASMARATDTHDSATLTFACPLHLVTTVKELRGIELRLPRPTNDGDPLEQRVAFAQVFDLWEEALERTDDASLPVSVGASVSARIYGPAGFVCMTQPSLQAAIAQLCRFERLWTERQPWALTVAGDEARLTYLPSFSTRRGARAYVEALLVEMVQNGRDFTGVRWTPRRIRFRHDPPAKTEAYTGFFDSAVEWGCEATEIVLDAELLDLPLRKADAEAAAFFEPAIARMLAKLGPSEAGLVEQLRALLASELRSGEPSLASVAAKLVTSERTLRRRLQEQGTSFQRIMDETRCELAKAHLATTISIGEVAFLLGFATPNAFHRAFKRWTSLTPAAYREQQRGKTD